jgi:hypothetical protein
MPLIDLSAIRATLQTRWHQIRRQTARNATLRALAPLSPALRDDLGLTHHLQLITFQNDKHKKHSFD